MTNVFAFIEHGLGVPTLHVFIPEGDYGTDGTWFAAIDFVVDMPRPIPSILTPAVNEGAISFKELPGIVVGLDGKSATFPNESAVWFSLEDCAVKYLNIDFSNKYVHGPLSRIIVEAASVFILPEFIGDVENASKPEIVAATKDLQVYKYFFERACGKQGD